MKKTAKNKKTLKPTKIEASSTELTTPKCLVMPKWLTKLLLADLTRYEVMAVLRLALSESGVNPVKVTTERHVMARFINSSDPTATTAFKHLLELDIVRLQGATLGVRGHFVINREWFKAV